MVAEARLEQTEHGLVPTSEGWFVLNAGDAQWRHAEGRSAVCDFEADLPFPQVGISPYVLGPGEAMGMYHWEADQEDFLVVSGEGVLIIEGEERPLRAWDFVHCPPNVSHTIVATGDGPCVVIAVGAREHQDSPDWGGYPVDEAALRHGAGVREETSDARVAYSTGPLRQPSSYREGWLPE